MSFEPMQMPAHLIPVVVLISLAAGCSGDSYPTVQHREIPVPPNAPEAVQVGIKCLNSPQPLQRAYGAKQLGSVDTATPQAVQALLIALEDGNYQVRGAAAESLGRLGAEQAAPALIEIMQNKAEDREVRARVAEALGRLRAKEAIEPLIAALDDLVWRVRYQAAVALGRIGDPSARNALANSAQYDPDYSARTAAQEALKQLN